jgi:hypothetical protein
VACVQQLAGAGAPFLADQAPGMSGDQPCQPLVRLRHRVSRAFQLRRVGLLFLGADQRP